MAENEKDDIVADAAPPAQSAGPRTDPVPWLETDLGELVGGIAICSVVAGILALTRVFPIALAILFVPAVALAAWFIDSQLSGPPTRGRRITAGIVAAVSVTVLWVALRIYCAC